MFKCRLSKSEVGSEILPLMPGVLGLQKGGNFPKGRQTNRRKAIQTNTCSGALQEVRPKRPMTFRSL